MSEERGNGETVVHFKGALTIQRAGELKDALLEAGRQSAGVTLEFDDYGGTDLSFLQLVCAVHLEAGRSGWSLQWGQRVPEEFMKTAEDYGFCRSRGCTRDRDGSCMWKALRGKNASGDTNIQTCTAQACAGRG